jgi:hypothetical protein
MTPMKRADPHHRSEVGPEQLTSSDATPPTPRTDSRSAEELFHALVARLILDGHVDLANRFLKVADTRVGGATLLSTEDGTP